MKNLIFPIIFLAGFACGQDLRAEASQQAVEADAEIFSSALRPDRRVATFIASISVVSTPTTLTVIKSGPSADEEIPLGEVVPGIEYVFTWRVSSSFAYNIKSSATTSVSCILEEVPGIVDLAKRVRAQSRDLVTVAAALKATSFRTHVYEMTDGDIVMSNGGLQLLEVEDDVVLTLADPVPGGAVTVLISSTAGGTLTFPAEWGWLGSKPESLTAGQRLYLTITAIASDDAVAVATVVGTGS